MYILSVFIKTVNKLKKPGYPACGPIALQSKLIPNVTSITITRTVLPCLEAWQAGEVKTKGNL
jgi:hypothetical protein